MLNDVVTVSSSNVFGSWGGNVGWAVVGDEVGILVGASDGVRVG